MENLPGDLSKFISKSPSKTRPMIVTVIDHTTLTSVQYLAPAGFQMERYVSSLFPRHFLGLSFKRESFVVHVMKGVPSADATAADALITYHGVYQGKLPDSVEKLLDNLEEQVENQGLKKKETSH